MNFDGNFREGGNRTQYLTKISLIKNVSDHQCTEKVIFKADYYFNLMIVLRIGEVCDDW